jgi:hypothetical protein
MKKLRRSILVASTRRFRAPRADFRRIGYAGIRISAFVLPLGAGICYARVCAVAARTTTPAHMLCDLCSHAGAYNMRSHLASPVAAELARAAKL